MCYSVVSTEGVGRHRRAFTAGTLPLRLRWTSCFALPYCPNLFRVGRPVFAGTNKRIWTQKWTFVSVSASACYRRWHHLRAAADNGHTQSSSAAGQCPLVSKISFSLSTFASGSCKLCNSGTLFRLLAHVLAMFEVFAEHSLFVWLWFVCLA